MKKLKLSQLFSRIFSSSLAKSSGIYTIASFINAAIPIFLLPILTRRLTPSDYGIVSMFTLAVSILYPFIGMNMEGSIQRRYFDKEKTDFASYIGTCFVLVAISFAIISGLFFLNIDFIQKVTQVPDQFVKYILIVAGAQFSISALLMIFQVNVKPIKYGILQILQSLFNIGITLILVVILDKTWDGRLEALLVTTIVFSFISVIVLIRGKKIKINVKKEDIINALKYGVPLIPHALGGIFFTSIDRFFLTNIIGLEQTGNYSVAYSIGMVISIITMAFNNAYSPWLFDNLNKNDFGIRLKIVKFTYLYFVVLLVGAVVLLTLFPFIVSILIGKQFDSINTYSTFIVFGFVFQGMYFMVTNYINYARKTYIQAIVTISVAVIKLPITYFSIMWLGASGASLSYCITFFIFFIATWILSAKVYKMPWNPIKHFKPQI